MNLNPARKSRAMNTAAAIVVSCIALAFILISCWGSPPSTPQFQRGSLTISRNGKPVKTLTVEIAESMREMEYGLMFRHEMPQDHGMIFLFSTPQRIQMWMKNTFLPLDMVFFDESQTAVAIVENARPQDETIIDPGTNARYVLEINAGLAAKWGVQKGDEFALERH